MIHSALPALTGSGVPGCAVSAGFPAAQTDQPNKIGQIERSVAAGAQEIDIVISRELVLTGRWEELYEEVAAYRAACGHALMKAILAAGDLATLRQVAQAARVCLLAGADFIKTSTGMESVNATIPVGLVMAGAIRDYRDVSGHAAGIKPAGGISSADQVIQWMVLVREELGPGWLQPALFRIGASSVLSDIEREIETAATGRPSAARRHPPG
jgi:deoxyribose-phosphate aldolase